jgi:hypothetical protein
MSMLSALLIARTMFAEPSNGPGARVVAFTAAARPILGTGRGDRSRGPGAERWRGAGAVERARLEIA